MPKTGDKVIIKGKNHSIARGLVSFVEDLKLNPWVIEVRTGNMRKRPGRRSLAFKIKWYNESNFTYKVEASTRDYNQDLYILVDPARRLFFERYLSSYAK